MTLRRALPAALIAIVVAGLVGLGVWQLERRVGKLALIAQTEAMLARPPVPAPAGAVGPGDAYRPVTLAGRYRGPDTFVQAVTELGGGYWVLTPLDTGGRTVLVNRGFVPADRRGAIRRPPGTIEVRGLLRLSEPGGGFLRSNDPAGGRWYSRDVAAIAAARGLKRTAPYFIDAYAVPGVEWPRGGMTVVRFRNNHLVYALTWFGLAALIAFLALRVARRAGTG